MADWCNEGQDDHCMSQIILKYIFIVLGMIVVSIWGDCDCGKK